MRIGLIARADNSGLGTLSWEFFNHLKPDKTLVVGNGVYKMFTDRFPGAQVCRNKIFSDEQMDWILEDIDLLITIETPYRWEIYPAARKKNVKTVLIPMYECLPAQIPYEPDFYICPSELDFDEVESDNKTFLPCPINTDKLIYRQRKKATTFVFNNGHGGGAMRNGLDVLLEALKGVHKDIQFIIHSQVSFYTEDDRIDLRIGNYKNYWDIWGEGDVYVWPHKFDGLSLPVQEALANGMPVFTTAFYPFKGWLPDEWLFDYKDQRRSRIFQREVDVYDPSPEALADLINRVAGTEIGGWSKKARKLAEERSWKVLKPKYLELFKEICGT